MNRRAGTRWVRAGLLPVFGIAAYGLAAHGLLHLVPEPDWFWDVWRDLAVWCCRQRCGSSGGCATACTRPWV